MLPSYKKHMKGGILISDGSKALVACAETLNLPFATVTHGMYQYVKPVKFKLSQLSKSVKARVMKRPASCSATHFYTLAGDNTAEGWFGTCASSRMRQGKQGRMAGRRAYLNQLSTSYLVKNPGLVSVLRALRLYREYAQDCMPPAAVYGPCKKTPWLKTPEA